LAAHCLLRDKKSTPLIKGSWSQEQNKQKNTIVHAGGELVCGTPHHPMLWMQEICMSWGKVDKYLEKRATGDY